MTVALAERLDLVNTTSRESFEMVLKESSSPVVLKESAWAAGQYPRVFEYIAQCDHRTEAIALTGILVEGSPDVLIRATVDGEYILKDAPIAKVSPAEFPDGFIGGEFGRTDIFWASTREGTQVGFFLPHGTHVCVFATGPVTVTLQTSLYRLKDPVQRAAKV